MVEVRLFKIYYQELGKGDLVLNNDLVSMIIPFYNGEEYLDRFLKSMIAQTYNNVQLIFVNDGSTDGSDSIIKNYLCKLENKFREVIYISQSNNGAASAVCNALKYVKGEYLCWADCDDELLPDNIYKKYFFLKCNKEYGMVNCGAMAISQISGEILYKMVIPKSQRNDNMFMQILDGIPVYPGVFMVRTQLLFDKLQDKKIYFDREAGQNYQLLLPVAYDNKCGFIDDILYNYYVREDSHSHCVDYNRAYQRTYVREKLLDNVLEFMPSDEKNKLMFEITYKCLIERFNLSFSANDKLNNNNSYEELKERKIDIKIKIKHFIINCKTANAIYRLIRRVI